MTELGRFRRLKRSLSRLRQTHYPGFLLGRGLEPREIPVFTYHDVDADTLRGDLEFLELNGYRTLGIDEYLRATPESSETCGRRVLLTFDDARRNFWEVAYPILEERGARATLFVPTYWIAGGRFPAHSVPAESAEFMTWEQIAHCDESHLVDVESHSHRHVLVNVAGRLVGFASPDSLARHDLFDWPLRRRGMRDECGLPLLGTPVYEAEPLLSAQRRVLEPPGAAEACRLVVEAGGGEAFFAAGDWAAQLTRVHDAAVSRMGGAAVLPTADFRREVETEVREGLAVFERELGRRPRVFAYPWMLGTPDTLRLLAELGVAAAFGVGLDFRRIRRGGAALRVFGRYKCDWLRFLPGRGRHRLRDVLPRKLAAFIRSQHLAH
jgi:peptidoglycan/xylan/chitin deacetylase (PgdA/CDA1 family)